LISSFCVILLTDKQTDTDENITFLADAANVKNHTECGESKPQLI